MKAFNLIVAALVLPLSACQTTAVKEAEPQAELVPLDGFNRSVGYQYSAIRDGKPYGYTLDSTDDGVYTYTAVDGCIWDTTADPFRPATRWENCENSKGGTQTIVDKGSAFPLTVGRKWSYAVDGINRSGVTWSQTRSCKVESAARITTVSGTHDTYKVFCSQGKTKRTWYVSPAVRDTVKLISDRGPRGKHVEERS